MCGWDVTCEGWRERLSNVRPEAAGSDDVFSKGILGVLVLFAQMTIRSTQFELRSGVVSEKSLKAERHW
jgi:hypothetical protein